MLDEPTALAALRALTDQMAERYGVGPDVAERLALVTLATALASDADTELPASTYGAVAEAFEHEEVVQEALLVLAAGIEGDTLRGVRRLLEGTVARHASAGANVVLARCLELDGDLVGMRRHLEAALRLDPGNPAANTDLGELHELLGDPRAARRHLDRAGRPSWGWAAIAASLGHGPIRAARNAPCPCDSGLRHKRCCGPTGGWSLAVRLALLPHRIAAWHERPAQLHHVLPLACEAAGVGGLEDDPARVLDAAIHPVVLAIHLFEGGGLGRLVDAVAPLLREDELDVLRGWPASRHRVWEVGRPDVRRSWQLTDVLTGEQVVAAGIDESVLESGADRILAVAVPIPPRWGPTHLTWGDELPLDDDEAERLVEALEADATAEELAGLTVGPMLDLFGSLLDLQRHADPAVTERITWLLGEDEAANVGGRIDLLDDLVTVRFMPGGGLSVAGDLIRDAAKRLALAEPPEVWAAAKRLEAIGADRETVLLEIALAWALADRDAGGDLAERERRFVGTLAAMPVQRLAG